MVTTLLAVRWGRAFFFSEVALGELWGWWRRWSRSPRGCSARSCGASASPAPRSRAWPW